MARGGARAGAGRKAGGKNKRTLAAEALREQILASGKSPLEVMIDGMQAALKRGAEIDSKLAKFKIDAGMDTDRIKALAELHAEGRRYLMAAHTCAVDAAPYLHPKLSSVEVSNPVGEAFEVGVNDLELARRVVALLTNAAVGKADCSNSYFARH